MWRDEKSLGLYHAALTPIHWRDIFLAVAGVEDEHFLEKLRESLHANDCVSFRSPKQAVVELLEAVRNRHGERGQAVVVPRFGCGMFFDAIEEAGLRPAYCDVDPETLTVQTSSFPKSTNVVAVLPVSPCGVVQPLPDIADWCREHNVRLVEDLTYALGARHGERKLGTFGDFAVCSFAEGKAIPIGGASVFAQKSNTLPSDEKRSKAPSTAHIATAYKLFSSPYLYRLLDSGLALVSVSVGKDVTASEDPTDGAPKALSEFQRRLGHRVLERLHHHRRHRNRIADGYRERLDDITGVTPVRPRTDVTPHFIRYPILVPTESRTTIQKDLLHVGVEASKLYHEDYTIDADRFPRAADVHDRILTLPTHPHVSGSTVETVCRVIERHC